MAKHSITIEFDDIAESVEFRIDAVLDKFGAGLSTIIQNDADCFRTYKQLLTLFKAIYQTGTNPNMADSKKERLSDI